MLLQGGGTVTSDSVRVRGDTVVTYQPEGIGAIPLAKVEAVQVKEFSTGKTLGFVAGLAAALFALFAATCCGS